MGANRAEAAFLLLALGTCTAISLNVSAHSTSHASQIPMPPLPQLGGAGHLDYTGAGLPPGSAALASPASVAQNVLDVLSIVPSSGQLTEGFGEELMDQQAALQQMQQDIAYQELMISKAEDYFQKLVSKVEDDRQIVEANKNIFSAWQEAVAKNAENFHGRISELNPTGEGYKRSGGFGSTGKQVKYKRRLLRRRKKKKSFFKKLLGGLTKWGSSKRRGSYHDERGYSDRGYRDGYGGYNDGYGYGNGRYGRRRKKKGIFKKMFG